MPQVAEHQFRAFLSAMPSTHCLAGIVLLACRKKDEKLLSQCFQYFSREFGVDYLTVTLMREIQELLTIEEHDWLWETIPE
jgi:predicted ATP-grasp superfamily ATP-dependent carboligase